MEMENDKFLKYFYERKDKAENLYKSRPKIYSPYFKCEIILNSDGLHHLQFKARSERDKKAQLLKFSLLPLAFEIINKAGTLQEYRKGLMTVGKKGSKDGLSLTKFVDYWGFIAIVGQKQVKIRVVLKRVGDGNVIFWSVMPYSKLKNNSKQKLYTKNIEDE
ncbi:MAG: hypothetical protein NT116_06630 [Candidatus Parcubacteria bacterium]|nr:hypothetical protein [Candidatus Parcubacteria bacterium]